MKSSTSLNNNGNAQSTSRLKIRPTLAASASNTSIKRLFRPGDAVPQRTARDIIESLAAPLTKTPAVSQPRPKVQPIIIRRDGEQCHIKTSTSLPLTASRIDSQAAATVSLQRKRKLSPESTIITASVNSTIPTTIPTSSNSDCNIPPRKAENSCNGSPCSSSSSSGDYEWYEVSNTATAKVSQTKSDSQSSEPFKKKKVIIRTLYLPTRYCTVLSYF